MKNYFLLVLIIFLSIFQIGFIFSEASSANFSADTTTGGISTANFDSNNFVGTSGTQNNPSLSSALVYVCGDGICNSGETCSSCPADCGCSSGYTCTAGTCVANAVTPSASSSGGGGGGGGIITALFPPAESFSLSSEQINVKIGQGRVTTQEVIITNNENQNLTIGIDISKISNFVSIKEPTITLKAKESRKLEFQIVALKDDIPDLYLGELNFNAEGEEKTILTAIEVVSANNLFDVGVQIPSQFLYVVPGKELYSTIELDNLGGSEQTVDVNLEYRILDSEGNEILHTTEELAVNTKMSFIKGFIIPSDTKLGKYVLYVKATYNNLTASSSAWFNLGKQTEIPFEWAIIIVIIFVIIGIALNIWNFRKIKKEKITCKVSEYDLKEAGIIKKIK